MRRLGQRIRLRRCLMGIEQAELASAVGCDESEIASIECGCTDMRIQMLVDVASALYTTPDRLIGYEM